jgi:murein DD-endopeptidase MepM/ murein hydrolase activator NlpD
MKDKSERYKKFLERLHFKYRLVIMDHETLEEKFSIQLSRFNVFVIGATSSVVIVLLTTLIIAYTPLREYIPGYATVDVQRKIYELRTKSDSLEKVFQQNNLYIYNMKRILDGKEMVEIMPNDSVIKEEIAQSDSLTEMADGSATSSDSLFRKEVESQMKYFGTVKRTTDQAPPGAIQQKSDPLKNVFFTSPVRGFVSNVYNSAIQHNGIDIVAAPGQPIHAVLDGTVIFAGWTVKTGYTIAIQHRNNIISVYKHNASLAKSEGNIVRAGDPIAIIGNTGSQTTGIHLHFELWQNGVSVDPKKYISF